MFLPFSADIVASATVWDLEVPDLLDTFGWDHSLLPAVGKNCSSSVDVEWNPLLEELTGVDNDNVGGVMSSLPYRWLVVCWSLWSEEVYVWSS